MSSRFRKKWAYVFLSGAFIFFLSQSAFAVETGGSLAAQPATQQPSNVLTAQQLNDYIADPAKLLTDFANNPDGLTQAITQLAVSGATGATAASSALQMAAANGNKSLAQAVAKGLGVAVAQLSNAGNLALASAIQLSVASIATAAGSTEIADAVNSSFAAGRNSTATAAIAGGGQGVDGGSAGVGGGVVGASNNFRGGGNSFTTNSSGGNLFGGTSSSSVPSPT